MNWNNLKDVIKSIVKCSEQDGQDVDGLANKIIDSVQCHIADRYSLYKLAGKEQFVKWFNEYDELIKDETNTSHRIGDLRNNFEQSVCTILPKELPKLERLSRLRINKQYGVELTEAEIKELSVLEAALFPTRYSNIFSVDRFNE